METPSIIDHRNLEDGEIRERLAWLQRTVLDLEARLTAAVLAAEKPLVTLAGRHQQLLARGFVRGPRPGMRAETVQDDRAAAAETGCERCGQPGLGFALYHHPEGGPGSLVEIAHCSRCGASHEF